MADFTIKQGDTKPWFEAQLLDRNGEPADLTDCSLRFIMASTSGGAAKVSAPAEIVGDPKQANICYKWRQGDTDTHGNFQAEVEVTALDGSKQTFPNDGYKTVAVLRKLG